MVGTVTIGAKDGNAVEEARRRISLILDPPTAEVGAIYQGKVVNITKFGAFVNILPGRDGLLHISKLSRWPAASASTRSRTCSTLGQAVEVRVDDIDPQGKVSLSLAVGARGRERRRPAVAAVGHGDSGGRGGLGRPGSDRSSGGRRRAACGRGASRRVSFEDAFEAELVADLGDLGPGARRPCGGRAAATASDRRRP